MILREALKWTAANGLLEELNVDGVSSDLGGRVYCVVGIRSTFLYLHRDGTAGGPGHVHLEILGGGAFGVDGEEGRLVHGNQLQTLPTGRDRAGVEYLDCKGTSYETKKQRMKNGLGLVLFIDHLLVTFLFFSKFFC